MQIYDFIDFLFGDEEFLIIAKDRGVGYKFTPDDLISAYMSRKYFSDIYDKYQLEYSEQLKTELKKSIKNKNLKIKNI